MKIGTRRKTGARQRCDARGPDRVCHIEGPPRDTHLACVPGSQCAKRGGHLNHTVYLAPYDPDWTKHFSLHAERIRDALSDKVLLLEHVGSTSVPGLSAKPVIDMVLAVANSADEAWYVPSLEARGFVLKVRELEWFQHRLLKTPDVAGNLHVFSVGCEEIDRMLRFRDWLRLHDDGRRLYEQTKRRLAAQTWKDTQQYADAKSEVVQEILSRAG